MNIHPLVGLVDLSNSRINITRKDALKVFKCGMKGTQSAEEVNVLKRHAELYWSDLSFVFGFTKMD